MTAYARQIALVLDVIKRKGAPANRRRYPQAAGAKDWATTPGAAVDSPIFAVFFPVALYRVPFGAFGLGTFDPRTSEIGYIPGANLADLLPSDKIVKGNGEIFTISKFDLIAPDGVPVLYIVQVYQ